MSDGVDSTVSISTCRWCGNSDDGATGRCPSCGQTSSPVSIVPAQPASPMAAAGPAATPTDVIKLVPAQPSTPFDDLPTADTALAVRASDPFSAPLSVAAAALDASAGETAPAMESSGYRYARPAGSAPPASGPDALPASFGSRVAARLIDGVILTVLTVVPVWIVITVAIHRYVDVFSITGGLLAALLVLEFVPAICYLIYRVGSDGGSGRSVGRAAMGIRLVPADGPDPVHPGRVGYWRAVGRLIVSGITDWLFFLGSLSMLWHPEQRTWADRAAGTRVIRDRTPAPGPGRILTATAVFAALITAGAGFAGVSARNNYERQLASSFTLGTDNGGGSTGTTDNSGATTNTDPSGGTSIDPSTTDGSSTDPGSTSVTGNSDGSTSTDPSATGGSTTPGSSASGSTTDTSPSQVGTVTNDNPSDSLSQSVASSLDTYFSGINSGDYSQAWDRESANSQRRLGTYQSFAAMLSTSQNSNIELHNATDNGDGTVSADVTFTSHQDGSYGPNPGETCTNWTITYSMLSDGSGGYLIDRTPSADHSAC